MTFTWHNYEVRPRQDKRRVDLNSDTPPFSRSPYIKAGHKCEQIHEPRLVDITYWGFAVRQNPFGVLFPQVVMNLLPEVRDRVDVSHNH